MKVLISAFMSFNNLDINYSNEVLKLIKNDYKIVLDVNYDSSYQDLCNSYNLNDFDLIIALGEARRRTELSIEKYARNISSCSICDNNGIFKKDEVIIAGNAECLNTLIPVEELGYLVSFDAGKFVCNNLYYYLLTYFPNKAIFIHIPNCYDNEELYLKYASDIEIIIERIGKLC